MSRIALRATSAARVWQEYRVGWIESVPGGVKSAEPHGGKSLWVLHEGLPDEAGSQVLSHDDRDAEVDTQHIGIVPES